MHIEYGILDHSCTKNLKILLVGQTHICPLFAECSMDGPFALFAGKDANRGLVKMSFEEMDLTGDISGLGPFELDALQD